MIEPLGTLLQLLQGPFWETYQVIGAVVFLVLVEIAPALGLALVGLTAWTVGRYPRD